jgi:hypothetical protein
VFGLMCVQLRLQFSGQFPHSERVVLTKSELLSFRQCPRKLWLKRHRADLLPELDWTSERRAIDGFKVGEKVRAILGADALRSV